MYISRRRVHIQKTAIMDDYCSEEQRAVVESEERYKLINGCAGSRKTDTLCRLCKKHYMSGKNVLIITLVGSVTNEIRERVEIYLGIAFVQRGNHFLGGGPDNFIEIANYDAMLHKQLSIHNDPFILRYGDCFEEKTQILYEKYVLTEKHTQLHMINGSHADVVMMDEFQDLQPCKARILTTVLKLNGQMYGVAAGDGIQSIFEHAFEENEKRPMEIWRDELGASCFDMTRCFRCPKAHVDFVNTILGPYREAFGIPRMISTNEDLVHKPVLFTCPPTTKNHSSDVIARQVCKCIAKLKEIDPSVVPSDIAIIMAKSNNNSVFRQIESRLRKLYEKWGIADAVKIFETKRDGVTTPIDWAKAAEKTVMLSVHGDKGKGHKVVFFLGLTDGTIPGKTRIFTDKELIDLSLINVGLTRSTRWLFVGFTRELPSRYLANVRDKLADHAILNWDPATYVGTRFESMCLEMNKPYQDHLPLDDNAPFFDSPHYVTRRVIAPNKLMCDVKNDLSFMYEHPKQVVPFYPWCGANVFRFGTKCPYNVKDELVPVYGVMGKMMFRRYHCFRRGTMKTLANEFDFLLDETKVHFSTNERLLNLVQDEMLNTEVKNGLSDMMFLGTLNRICANNSRYVSGGHKLRAEISAIMAGKKAKFFLPTSMKQAPIREDVRLFLDPSVANRDIPTKTFWNMALLFIMLFERVRIPYLSRYTNFYDVNLDVLHANIEQFYEMIKGIEGIRFHEQYRVTGIERDPDVLSEMGMTDQTYASYGIRGISDFESNRAIFEIKCPVGSKYSNSWTMQPLLYHCLNARSDRAVDEINVVDLTNGAWYRFPGMDKINKKHVLKSVLTKLKYRDEHAKVLLSQIAQDVCQLPASPICATH